MWNCDVEVMLGVMGDLARYRWIATNILPHEPELRGWLRRRLGAFGENDIDDLVQEAFARIWAADFAQIRNPRSYLFATVRHLLAEYARRSRIVRIELLGEIDSLNVISDEPGPERRLGARQELETLRAIVAALPPQCRQVFELLKFEGLSHRDVAKRMQLSAKTVENHLTRAFARIASALATRTLAGDLTELKRGSKDTDARDNGND
jgi:RNA polymerase sigma factor (sigma-70 family)